MALSRFHSAHPCEPPAAPLQQMLPPMEGDRPRTTELDITGCFEHFLHQVSRKLGGSPALDPEVCYVEPLQSFKRKTLPLFLFPDGKRPAAKPRKKKPAGGVAAGGGGAASRTTSAASASTTASTPDATAAGGGAAGASTEADGRPKRPAEEDLEADESKKAKAEAAAAAAAAEVAAMEVDDELELAAANPPSKIAAPPVIGAPKLRLQSPPT